MVTRLLRLRLALGLTQDEAARRTGVSVPTWRAWERVSEFGEGPWPSAKRTQRLVPGALLQVWLLDGGFERGRDICRDVGKDLAEVACLEAHILPEVGRSIFIVWPDDLEEWREITGMRLDGRRLIYETARGDVPVEQVLGVRP